MNILVGMESSGIIRDAFAAKGHNAVSCDLLPTERPGNHYQGDVRDIVIKEHWDLFIFHPTCTYVCGSGIHWNKRVEGRSDKTNQAIEYVKEFWKLANHIPKICMENPIGVLSTQWKRARQVIQPYNFGEDASKATCLWLRRLSRLNRTQYVEPRIVDGKKRWANQTDSGQNKLTPSEDRWKERSRTYPGIAAAMAQQWG